MGKTMCFREKGEIQMNSLIEALNSIPFGLAVVVAMVGLIPMFAVMRGWLPKGVRQHALVFVVYGSGSVGALSIISHFVSAASI